MKLRIFRTVMSAALMWLAAAAPSVAGSVTVDDTARFLAGMLPAADSPLMPLTHDPAWQRHAKFFDNAFAQLEARQLSKIRSWSEAHLAAPRPTMFYMFSGPDFLYANAFYPKAATYVLSALEPIGQVPDLTTMSPAAVAAALYNVERALSSILSFSFFITQQMKTDLRAGQIGGTLPILYVFLARAGQHISSVAPVTLDENGTVGGANAGKNLVQGIRIGFAGKEAAERTLYYFSTDLSNPGVKGSGFLKFCASFGPGNSLIKSASYLMHGPSFTTIRDFILTNSATVIQDDSGIPLVYFNRRRWKFFPFGRYLKPIDKFPDRFQDSYAELFARAEPIDFGIGYRWRTHETNLLLAVKLPDDGTAAADAVARDAPPPKPPRQRPMRQAPIDRDGGDFFWFWR